MHSLRPHDSGTGPELGALIPSQPDHVGSGGHSLNALCSPEEQAEGAGLVNRGHLACIKKEGRRKQKTPCREHC